MTAAGSDRPVRIGVSSCFFPPDDERPIFKGKTLLYVEESMVHWVQRAGVLACPIPTVAAGTTLTVTDQVADLDGLLLHGGSDVCPRTYGEEPLRPEWEGDAVRDGYEIELVRAFVDAGKPVLGICRGHQILNVAFGGTLWQDLTAQGVTERVHRDPVAYDHNLHTVRFGVRSDRSLFDEWYPQLRTAVVNSIHHQAVRDVAEEFVVEAVCDDDGVVEAIRHRDTGSGGPFVVGVQWHPEFFDGVDDGTMLDNTPVREAFVEEARRCR